MNDFLNAFNSISKLENKLEYRLYYNKTTGEPMFYSMDNLPGDFIKITCKEYAVGNYNVFVKDNEIIEINNSAPSKLVPSTQGTSTTKENVMIIDETAKNYWSIKQCY